MADSFDPYYIWLGIPPDERPAHHYRLLAINVLEANPDVIESAADRQMAHLRTFQGGKHAADSQRLLNEVTSAKLTLLDPEKKAAYDRALKAKLAAAKSAVGAPPPLPISDAPPPPLPVAHGAPLPVAQSLAPTAAAPAAVADAAPAEDWDSLLGTPAAGPAASQVGKSSIGKSGNGKSGIGKNGAGKSGIGARGNAATAAPTMAASAPKPVATASPAPRAAAKKKLSPWVFAAPVAAILIALGICLYVRNQPDPPPPNNSLVVLDWPFVERRNVKVWIDDERVPPADGAAWEFAVSPGVHHLKAERTGYKPIEQDVTVGEEQKLPFLPPWVAKASLVVNFPGPIRPGTELKVDGRPQSLRDKTVEVAVEPGEHQVEVRRPNAPLWQAKAPVKLDQKLPLDVPPAMGKLLVVWPLGQRDGGELRVDGQLQPRDPRDPVEIRVTEGPHKVWVGRPGFNPFESSIAIEPGENKAVTVSLVATAGTVVKMPDASKTDSGSRFPGPNNPSGTASNTSVGPGPGKEPAKEPDKPTTSAPVATKAPVPSPTDFDRVAKQVDQLYKTARTSNIDEDIAHIKELMDVAAKTTDAPVDRYVLMYKAIDLAEDAGEATLALDGIDSLDRDYVVDAADLRQKAIDRLSKSATREDAIVAVATAAEKMADDLIAEDKYDAVSGLLSAASRAVAKKAASVDYRREVEKRLGQRRAEIKTAQSMLAAVDKAKKTLETDAADPDANSVVGRWLCFHKQQWDEGLPYLKKAKDDKLKALAAKELPPPTDAEKQVDLADGWYDIAATQPAAFKDAIFARAGQWYEKALPTIGAGGLTKAKIDKRLKEIADAHGDKPGKTATGKAIVNSIGMKLAWIPAGEFLMGSPANEPGRANNETQHKVKLTRPFYMGVYPVTQGEYYKVTGANPAYFSAGNNVMVANSRVNTERFPIENVSFEDAEQFCQALSNMPREKGAGRIYRLPTEAEWEYACRAGTTTPFNFGTSISLQLANYRGTDDFLGSAPGAKHNTVQVGMYKPNAFGLYDMHGNVFQMCGTWFNGGVGTTETLEDPQGPTSGYAHVMRGGCFNSQANQCRAAYKGLCYQSSKQSTIGFRVVCETAATATAKKP